MLAHKLLTSSLSLPALVLAATVILQSTFFMGKVSFVVISSILTVAWLLMWLWLWSEHLPTLRVGLLSTSLGGLGMLVGGSFEGYPAMRHHCDMPPSLWGPATALMIVGCVVGCLLYCGATDHIAQGRQRFFAVVLAITGMLLGMLGVSFWLSPFSARFGLRVPWNSHVQMLCGMFVGHVLGKISAHQLLYLRHSHISREAATHFF